MSTPNGVHPNPSKLAAEPPRLGARGLSGTTLLRTVARSPAHIYYKCYYTNSGTNPISKVGRIRKALSGGNQGVHHSQN